VGKSRPGGADHPEKVDPENPLHFLVAHPFEKSGRAHPGIVDQDIDPTAGGSRLRDHPLDLLRPGDIGRNGPRFPPRFPDQGSGFFGPFAVDIRRRDPGPGPGEPPGDPAPDPASGPGHQSSDSF
jgi:hypothetical protein